MVTSSGGDSCPLASFISISRSSGKSINLVYPGGPDSAKQSDLPVLSFRPPRPVLPPLLFPAETATDVLVAQGSHSPCCSTTKLGTYAEKPCSARIRSKSSCIVPSDMGHWYRSHGLRGTKWA